MPDFLVTGKRRGWFFKDACWWSLGIIQAKKDARPARGARFGSITEPHHRRRQNRQYYL